MQKLAPAVWVLLGTAQQGGPLSRAIPMVAPCLQVRSLSSAVKRVFGFGEQSSRQISYSSPALADQVTTTTKTPPQEVFDAAKKKYMNLQTKDPYDEVWAYEDKYGTAEDPIEIPATGNTRTIGLVDGDDPFTVVWGQIYEGDPPRQLLPGGEYYVLKKVTYVPKVADVLDAWNPPQVEK